MIFKMTVHTSSNSSPLFMRAKAQSIWRRMMAWLPPKRVTEQDLAKRYSSLPLPPIYTTTSISASASASVPPPAAAAAAAVSALYQPIIPPPQAHHPLMTDEPSSSMVVMTPHQASYTSHVPSVSPASSLTLSSSSIMTLDDNNSDDYNDDPTPPTMYSNFYLKLPNGQYMVRCRTADRRIIGSFVIEGHMI
ncbi:hypothetical protein BCR43DRAFT_499625 [Syncephalastrum racemosum]|uniref:Uncharacterized protein n=1 Tax=Syncephalastrum racemosum TaxID=13706 RepID=A0A1X2GZJ3_SYNRA|nr:hypothetical protein BCR43DRAFT_499625 [Syncephalastrum racemosum]